MVVRKDQVWYVYGVTSFGYQCAQPDAPGVYVRITAYVDWILANSDNLIVAPGVLDGAKSCADNGGVATDVTGSMNNPETVTVEGETPAPTTEATGCELVSTS